MPRTCILWDVAQEKEKSDKFNISPKIQLNVYENNKIIDTVENVTNTDPVHLIKALEEFRQIVNEKLTQKVAVDDSNNFDDYIEEEMNSSDDEEITKNCGSPKKRKT